MKRKVNGQFAGDIKIEVKCRQCGDLFFIYQAWIRKGGGKYCSKKCHDLSQRKNGVSTRDDGYVSIKIPNHPRSNKWGFVYEHILAAEQKLGRALKEKEVVHHLNGNPSDNKLANICIFDSQADHAHHHAIQRIVGDGVNPETEKRCPKCKQVLSKDRFSPSSSRGKKCLSSTCKPCRVKYERERRVECL
jgi:hypothetical protein